MRRISGSDHISRLAIFKSCPIERETSVPNRAKCSAGRTNSAHFIVPYLACNAKMPRGLPGTAAVRGLFPADFDDLTLKSKVSTV